MSAPGASAKRVFCSYRGVDRERVEQFVANLQARGIAAWFDQHEIRAGDDTLWVPCGATNVAALGVEQRPDRDLNGGQLAKP